MISLILFLGIVLALVPVFAPELGLTRHGRLLGFVVLFLIPLACAALGTRQHIEQSRTTRFCNSCHVMELHTRSLRVDDDTLLATTHFLNGAVPREEACFACHTTYTMYGDFEAKLRGLKHLYFNYTKPNLDETKIKTYDAYHNRECLHCHEGTRKFERGKQHRVEAGSMQKIRNNEKSCIAKGCHEFVHDVSNIKDQALWAPPKDDADQPAPAAPAPTPAPAPAPTPAPAPAPTPAPAAPAKGGTP